MRGSMARHAFDCFRHIDDFPRLFVIFIEIFQVRTCRKRLINRHAQFEWNRLGNLVGLCVTDGKRPADIAHRLLCLHGSEGYNLRNSALAVFLSHIIDDLLTALVAEVYIDIRHADTLRIQESLKNQVISYRIDVRNLQAISNDRSRRRAPARPHHDSVVFGIVDEVPYNQEIFHIPHALDCSELIVQPVFQFLVRVFSAIGVAVPVPETRVTKFPKVCGIVFSVRCFEFRQMIFTESEVEIALLGNFLRVVAGLRAVSKNLTHFVFAFQIKLIVRKAHSLFVVKRCRRLNRQKHIMCLRVFASHIMRIIGCHKRNAEFLGQLPHVGQNRPFFFQSLVLKLEIKIPFAENFKKHLGFCLGTCIIA